MPSGGLLDGDELDAEITIEPGAALHLRTLAATQLHRGSSGQSWRVRVEEGAAFRCTPHLLVPHAGARHWSRMALQLATSSSVAVSDGITAGRMHSGEWLAYDELRMDLDVWRDGRLAARERQSITPGQDDVAGQLGPYSCHASAYFLGPDVRLPSTGLDSPDDLLVGTSELAGGGFCARVLGQRACEVESALARLAEESQGSPAPEAGAAHCANRTERVKA